MDRTDQTRILTDLCDGIKEDLLKKLPDVPENWDGIELRQWVADYVSHHVNYKSMDKRRYREYNNDCLIKNLY